MTTASPSSSSSPPPLVDPAHGIQSSHDMLTRTAAFQRLSKWAFTVCDADQTGQINRQELYSGILMVHLQLAKYAGAAACYPPTPAIIDGLFDASDEDHSGTIDREEFHKILVVCCAQIMSRIIVYYAIIILLVPYVANFILDTLLSDYALVGLKQFAWIQAFLTFGEIAETMVSLLLFFLLVPMLFDYIDRNSKRAAELTPMRKVTKAS